MTVAKANSIRPLVAGNWKMNGHKAQLTEAQKVGERVARATFACDVMICPPATLVSGMVAGEVGEVLIGGQDCHAKISGAHTGDISAEMLKDAGASAVIVGHSERRTDHGETDAIVRAKAEAASRAGLLAIVCVGETEAQRKAGQALTVVEAQLKSSLPDSATAKTTAVAYEPVWAIGTGLTPSRRRGRSPWCATAILDSAFWRRGSGDAVALWRVGQIAER